MHKYKLFAALLAVLMLLCSGCNYKELDDNIQDNIQQIQREPDANITAGTGADASDGAKPVYIAPLSEDDIIYKGVGETFSAYRKYSAIAGGAEDIIERGKDGLSYTLKGITTYSTLSEADIKWENCLFSKDNSIAMNNSFILIDIEASYTAPTEGDKEIIADIEELSGVYLVGKKAQEETVIMEPLFVYFSDRPTKDNPRLDYQHEGNCYIIQDGETLTFQVGLICAQEYINDKNVFLGVNEIPGGIEAAGDTTRKLFVLFPEGNE